MKPLLFLALFILALLFFATRDISDITNEDLQLSLSTHPELYDYKDFVFTNKVQRRFADRLEMEYDYQYTRRAKTHIAFIDGDYVSVDNAFVNECIDEEKLLDTLSSPCMFVTEMGTVEQVQSEHAHFTVERLGKFSLKNIQKKLLSKETFVFFNTLLQIFKNEPS